MDVVLSPIFGTHDLKAPAADQEHAIITLVDLAHVMEDKITNQEIGQALVDNHEVTITLVNDVSACEIIEMKLNADASGIDIVTSADITKTQSITTDLPISIVAEADTKAKSATVEESIIGEAIPAAAVLMEVEYSDTTVLVNGVASPQETENCTSQQHETGMPEATSLQQSYGGTTHQLQLSNMMFTKGWVDQLITSILHVQNHNSPDISDNNTAPNTPQDEITAPPNCYSSASFRPSLVVPPDKRHISAYYFVNQNIAQSLYTVDNASPYSYFGAKTFSNSAAISGKPQVLPDTVRFYNHHLSCGVRTPGAPLPLRAPPLMHGNTS